VDESILTPRVCEAIGRARARRPRFLMMARHPVESAGVEPRFSFVSRRLLKGLPASDLLAAIRET
jgi:hypothetical protein